MDLINEFAYILSKNNSSDFNSVLPENSKIRKLYDLVISKEVRSDEEAAEHIYNSTKADKKYLMLKRNLVQKLSDLVYLQEYIDVEKDNYMNIKFQIEKELLIAEKLLLNNVYHNPTKIIAKAEQTAESYYFIDIQVAAARKFRSVYSLKGHPKETEEYDEKVKRLEIYQSYYNSSKGMWEKLYSKTKYTGSYSKDIVEECNSSIQKIASWLKEYDSPFIRLYYYKINILLNHQLRNQVEVLSSLNELEKLSENYPFIETKSFKLDLNYYFARYFRDIKQPDLAQNYIDACQQISDYRAFDKFLIQELNFDIQIKKGEYLKAAEIVKSVYSVTQYQFLNDYDKAKWTIFQAYLFFIAKATGQEDLIKYLPLFSKPKSLHSFLDKSKKWAKDKYGYNISLLIVRVLLYKINKLEDIDNEGNNMLVYYHRYLKDINSRITIFFYQLAKTILQGCEEDVLKDRYVKLSKKLQECNLSYYDSFEIIPFETFWELIIKLCSKR